MTDVVVDQAGLGGRATPPDWRGTAAVPMDADQAFNGFVAANVVFALDRLGVWALLEGAAARTVAELRAATGAVPRLLDQLLLGARTYGYLTGDDRLALTAAGREMARMRGYFTWAVGGYSQVFASAGPLAAGQRRYPVDVVRDEAMVALGSGQNDRSFMAGTLDEVLAELDFASVADLGSGISARVCRIAAAHPGTRGLGVDISGPATRLAHETIAGAGLTGQVSAIQADVLDLVDRREHRELLGGVDTVLSFFLLHDLLADPVTRPTLFSRLREAFPAARTFVLADTMVRPGDATEPTVPVFSVGYELAHALMGVPLHPRETYEELFAGADLRIRKVLPFGTPHSWLYVLDAS